MADHPETAPRLQVIVYRDQGKWRWAVPGNRIGAGPWVRIESAVTNLEEVLGVKCEWVKPRRGLRTLTTTGRPVDVEIRR